MNLLKRKTKVENTPDLDISNNQLFKQLEQVKMLYNAYDYNYSVGIDHIAKTSILLANALDTGFNAIQVGDTRYIKRGKYIFKTDLISIAKKKAHREEQEKIQRDNIKAQAFDYNQLINSLDKLTWSYSDRYNAEVLQLGTLDRKFTRSHAYLTLFINLQIKPIIIDGKTYSRVKTNITRTYPGMSTEIKYKHRIFVS